MSNSFPTMFQRILARPTAVEADAADLGTCFGLECSLAHAEPEPAAEVAPPSRRPRWFRRLDLFGRFPG